MASKASDLKALTASLVVIVNHLQQLDFQIGVGLRPDATPDPSDFKKGMRRCGAIAQCPLAFRLCRLCRHTSGFP